MMPSPLALRGRARRADLSRKWGNDTRGWTLNRSATQKRGDVAFYGAPDSVLWITFFGDCLWWCFAIPTVELLPDGSKQRRAIGGWSNKDLQGNLLAKSRLSGRVLAVQSYQMTICAADRDYVLQRINGTEPPHVKRANEALEQMVAALVPIISGLHPKDLEILVDLIFRNGGWNRIGVVGETEPDIDLALESPVTGERIAVQVKSRASPGDYHRAGGQHGRLRARIGRVGCRILNGDRPAPNPF